MTDNTRDYRIIDPEKLEPEPFEGSIEDYLREALLDIIQVAESEGMTEDQVDTVLREIIDLRAAGVRRRFILHKDDGEQPAGTR